MTSIARKRSNWSARSRQERLGLRLLLPVFGTVVVIATIPFILAVIRALTADDGHFIGLDNFTSAPRATSSSTSRSSRPPSTRAIVLPTEILLGLGLALLVHRTVRSTGVRAADLRRGHDPDRHSADRGRRRVPPRVRARLRGHQRRCSATPGPRPDPVALAPPLAMLSVASVDIWQWTPFVYLIMFAGLQTVPVESVEAAQVDGATSWTQFRHIELPLPAAAAAAGRSSSASRTCCASSITCTS